MLGFLKHLSIAFIWVVVSILYPQLGLTADQDIIILHTNDIHCSVNENVGMTKVSW